MTKRKNTADILKPTKPKRAYKKKTAAPPVVAPAPVCPEVLPEPLVEEAPLKTSLFKKLLNWLLK